MEVYPIGFVRYLEEGENTGNVKQIEVCEQFSDGLKGVENVDSLLILFWMNRLDEGQRQVLQVHPRGDTSKEKRGVFVLRSPMRPNPIGLTKVRLVKREGNILTVEGLDALDDTPVIDIKMA